MDDLERYIEARKARDPGFTDGFEIGYEQFKIGVILRAAREDAGLTQDDLAEKSKSGLQSMQNKVQAGRGKIVDRIRKVEADVRTKVEDLKTDKSQPKEDSEE